MTLVDCFNEVSDFRRAEGLRYPLTTVLLLSVMGVCCGYHGYRELDTFCRARRNELVKWFGLKRPQLPSHVTFRTVLKNIDFDEFSAAFQKWVHSQVEMDSGDWVSLDGKTLGSTVTNSQNSQQNFVSLVSAFAHKQQQVLGVTSLENNKESEIPSVQNLIKSLGLQGVVFSLDALHCQKKQQNISMKVITTT